ncbi:MAG: SpoIIE family protein phosphatase [Actinomycetota bacterium]|nr:SpoIIE family protein phosphatase [Actinomycetota bacterium]
MSNDEADATAARFPSDAGSALADGERVVDALLSESHGTALHELPALLARYADMLGAADAVAYLADLQQKVLVPFLGVSGPALNQQADPLSIDSTLAGRCFQHVEVLSQHLKASDAGARVWLPLLNGSERLGVLAVSIADPGALDADGGPLGVRLRLFASLAAELIMTKALSGDTIVRLRRRAEMGLAAEMQWSLLPPLTFASDQVSIAAALEPAYQVAGDSVDYAVDAGRACFAVFDGMGHSLRSAQLATVAVAAYRNSRRAGRSLSDVAQHVDAAVSEAFDGEAFTTAVLAELDSDTGVLSWVSAGHPQPLLLRDGRMIKQLTVDPGLPLGLSVDLAGGTGDYPVGAEQLEAGDQILLFSDGVTEARSPSGEFFGLSRLTDLLSRTIGAGLPASESIRRLVHALLEHQQDLLTDDATLLLAEWRAAHMIPDP